VDGFWATKSEGVVLIVRAICFQDFQPMWSWSTNVTERRTDRRTTCNLNTALCAASRGKNSTDRTARLGACQQWLKWKCVAGGAQLETP